MPMPIDLTVTYQDGSSENFYIPLQMMRGEKPADGSQRTPLDDWAWAYPTYTFNLPTGRTAKSIVIDPSGLMADVKADNNTYTAE